MPRNGADARARLRDAALQLYAEQGYDRTTTAVIAQRAGVTERTFFRHFADKREVLFDGEDELARTMARAVDTAPSGTAPLDLALCAYRAAIPLFVAGRPVAQRRAAIIATSPALQERAHAKAAHLTQELTDALVRRAVAPGTAALVAGISAVLFDQAATGWGGTSAQELDDLIDRAVEQLHALLATTQ